MNLPLTRRMRFLVAWDGSELLGGHFLLVRFIGFKSVEAESLELIEPVVVIGLPGFGGFRIDLY